MPHIHLLIVHTVIKRPMLFEIKFSVEVSGYCRQVCLPSQFLVFKSLNTTLAVLGLFFAVIGLFSSNDHQAWAEVQCHIAILVISLSIFLYLFTLAHDDDHNRWFPSCQLVFALL
jgi:hypothetical protein